jgi:hypothetical protein
MVGKLVGGMNRVWLRLILAVALVLGGIVMLAVAHWPDIEFELGYAYESGHFHGMPGFAKDPQQAVLWLERAARAGHPRAQYRLGILLAHGWGAPRRSDLANAWLNASARNGYAPASYHLGWMYHKGDGVPRDEVRAVRLLEQAASQGMVAAHLALGGFYARGEGVEADLIQACKWYVVAVHFAQTQPELFDNAAFTQRARAAFVTLTAAMNPASVEQGQALAAKWLNNRN